jgi:hypothetical protein
MVPKPICDHGHETQSARRVLARVDIRAFEWGKKLSRSGTSRASNGHVPPLIYVTQVQVQGSPLAPPAPGPHRDERSNCEQYNVHNLGCSATARAAMGRIERHCLGRQTWPGLGISRRLSCGHPAHRTALRTICSRRVAIGGKEPSITFLSQELSLNIMPSSLPQRYTLHIELHDDACYSDCMKPSMVNSYHLLFYYLESQGPRCRLEEPQTTPP